MALLQKFGLVVGTSILAGTAMVGFCKYMDERIQERNERFSQGARVCTLEHELARLVNTADQKAFTDHYGKLNQEYTTLISDPAVREMRKEFIARVQIDNSYTMLGAIGLTGITGILLGYVIPSQTRKQKRDTL